MNDFKRLTDPLTLEEIAGLTDAEMIRRRFDRNNARYVGVLATLMLVYAFVEAVRVSVATNLQSHMLPVAIGHILFTIAAAAAFGELAYAERRSGWKPRLPVHLIARNLTPWVLTFVIVHFTFAVFCRTRASNDWFALGFIVPWIVIPMRLELSRRIALHVSLFGIVLLSAFILGIGGTDSKVPELTTMATMSIAAFVIGAATSRRVRRQTLEEWSDRRTQAREQVRMRNELQYAREVQLSMLPDSAPEVAWLDLAGTSIPASEVGGDYYDYFVEDGAVAIVCGDVAGHGLASGIVLASLRAGFTLLRDSLADPASVLSRLSDVVARASRRRMLATSAVVRFDRKREIATIASAGHPPVLVRTSMGVKAIELFAVPLGVRLPSALSALDVPYTGGDVFLLHSDGLYEAVNEHGEAFGLERLEVALGEASGTTSQEILHSILDTLERFRAGTQQNDDVTLVVARIV